MQPRVTLPVSFKGISVQYRQPGLASVAALSGVNIPFVCDSQRIAITGANGSGKSTLIDSLAGRLAGVGIGSVALLSLGEDRPLGSMPDIMNLGYVPQTPSDGIVPSLTVRENLLLPKLARINRATGDWSMAGLGGELEVWVRGLSPTADLEHRLDHDPFALSGGFQQVLCLAANLFSAPDVLFLDEPTSKLSPNFKREIWDILASPAAASATMIYSSHDMPDCLRIAHRQIILNAGRVVYDGPPQLDPGGVRYGEAVATRSQLPPRLQRVDGDWWAPGRFFTATYEVGDDSTEGYRLDMPLTRSQRTEKEVLGCIALAKRFDAWNEEPKVLDAPCGFGRHLSEFASRGARVLGVDISPDFVREARRICVDSVSNIRVREGDLRELPVPDSGFDLACNLYTSFGFFSRAAEDNKVLSEFRRVLRPGGLALVHFDFNPRRVVRGEASEPAFRTIREHGRLFVRELFCEEDSRLYGIWDVLFPDGKHYEREYSLRVYGEREWAEMALAAELELMGFFGALKDDPPPLTDDSREFVVVLRKRK